MRKTWLIAKKTYRERVRSGMFLILTFGIPLLMIIVAGIAFITARDDETAVPDALGIVDGTGELVVVEQVALQEELIDVDETLRFEHYAGTEGGERAYLDGEIGGYLLIPTGYFEGAAVHYFSDEDPSAALEGGLQVYLRRALYPQQPEWVFARLDDPATYSYVAQASGETVAEGPGLVVRVAMPAFLAMIFVFAVLFGTTQMGAAIIQEKEQRAMEMIVTSLRPMELVSGKMLGMTLLSLTQLGIWIAGAIVALLLAFSEQVQLQELAIPWGTLLWGTALIIPGYFLYAVLAAGLGIIAGNSQQAQQLAGVLSLVGLAPIYLLAAILANPDGPLALALTLFPLSSPSISLMRSVFFDVPTWQLAAAFAILLVSLAMSVWFVARIFRAAMLNYGKALRPREVWRALVRA